MTSMRSSILAVAGTLLVALGAVAASGHEAHRKGDSVTPQTIEAEQPTPLTPLTPLSEAAGVEPIAAVDSGSSQHLHALYAASDPAIERVSVLSWLGRLHPTATHFPIALFLAALAAELLFIATQHQLFRHALRFCLFGAAISAVIAAPLGWMFAASGATEENWILEAHRWSGAAAACLGVVVLWVVERTERTDGRRLSLRVSLVIQALLIGSVGFLGGSLLYGFDHFWRGL